jgi:hypothetical protein
MMDSEEESEGNEAKPEELDPVALLESLKKKSNVVSNETEIQVSSPFAAEARIDHAVARAPSPIETGTDDVFSSGKEVDEDSLGPTEVLKQIRKKRERKEYEEH